MASPASSCQKNAVGLSWCWAMMCTPTTCTWMPDGLAPYTGRFPGFLIRDSRSHRGPVGRDVPSLPRQLTSSYTLRVTRNLERVTPA